MTDAHHYVFIDPLDLAKTRESIRAGSTIHVAALARLVARAEFDLVEPITSVLDKTGIAPSGDKQDFWAIGAYSWPNPNTPDGLPYVYRDSKYNPEASESTEYDKGAYSRTVAGVKNLSLAWYFTGNVQYASKAARLLRTWFIDPATRMKPHFRHAAARPGVYDGHHSGTIEGAILIEMLDYVGLLDGASEWSAADLAGLREWFEELSGWYAHSGFGRADAATTNNHSSYFLAQVLAFASFGGNHRRARAVIPLARRQLRLQVAADGSLPRELARPSSFYYAVYGLRAFILLARSADQYDADLWRYRDDSRLAPTIGRGLAWLAPYCSGAREWTLPRHGSGYPHDALPIYWIAARAYDATVLREVIEFLSQQERTDHATLLYSDPFPVADSEADLFPAPRNGAPIALAASGPLARIKGKLRSGLVALRLMPEGRIP